MTSRRVVLTGVLAAPLLGLLGQSAHADQPALYRIIDGWGQARLTPAALDRLRSIGATVYAIEPAVLVGDPNVPTVRMPLDSGKFNRDFTKVIGAIAGGFGLRTLSRDAHVTKIAGSLSGTSGKGSFTVNNEQVNIGPLYTDIRNEAVISVEQGPPGYPSLVKFEVPLRPTPEAIDLFIRYFGVPLFSTGMYIAHASGECRFLSSS